MDLAKLRDQPHISVSAISDYMDCGLLYKFSRVDRLKPEFKPGALILGTAVHATLAEFYQELKADRKMNLKPLQGIFTDHWTLLAQDREDIRYKPEKDFEILLLEGKELLGAFHQKLPEDEGEILGIEEPFQFWIDGLPVPIIGAYDVLLEDPSGTITVVDHKTTAKAYISVEVDRNFQLTIYHMAARANGYEDREVLLRLDCLIKTKTPKFEQYYSTRSTMDEMKAVRKILAVWEGIQKGVFIPNDESWKCSGCGYKQACENWFAGGGHGQEEE